MCFVWVFVAVVLTVIVSIKAYEFLVTVAEGVTDVAVLVTCASGYISSLVINSRRRGVCTEV